MHADRIRFHDGTIDDQESMGSRNSVPNITIPPILEVKRGHLIVAQKWLSGIVVEK